MDPLAAGRDEEQADAVGIQLFTGRSRRDQQVIGLGCVKNAYLLAVQPISTALRIALCLTKGPGRHADKSGVTPRSGLLQGQGPDDFARYQARPPCLRRARVPGACQTGA